MDTDVSSLHVQEVISVHGSSGGAMITNIIQTFSQSAVQTPEPLTWLLLGTGLVALAFARKKLAA